MISLFSASSVAVKAWLEGFVAAGTRGAMLDGISLLRARARASPSMMVEALGGVLEGRSRMVLLLTMGVGWEYSGSKSGERLLLLAGVGVLGVEMVSE